MMVTILPATADRWDDVVGVMGTRGDPARCWCQFFMVRQRDWVSTTPESRQQALETQVRDRDAPPGVLAYLDDEAVGWCAIAEKADYPRLMHSPNAGSEIDGVWSLTCFVVKVGQRRKGVASSLLVGAVEFARDHGARIIEGYAVDPSARDSVSAAELYRGTVSMFADAGFTEVERTSPARARMRLAV